MGYCLNISHNIWVQTIQNVTVVSTAVILNNVPYHPLICANKCNISSEVKFPFPYPCLVLRFVWCNPLWIKGTVNLQPAAWHTKLPFIGTERREDRVCCLCSVPFHLSCYPLPLSDPESHRDRGTVKEYYNIETRCQWPSHHGFSGKILEKFTQHFCSRTGQGERSRCQNQNRKEACELMERMTKH